MVIFFLCHLSSFIFYSIHSINSVYMSIPPPNSSHPLIPPLVSICLCYVPVSLFLPCKPVHLYHFSRFHIYASIYNIYFLYSRFLLVLYFIHISVYMSVPISQFIPPPPPAPLSPLGVHTFVLYICVSISALQTGSSVPFF